MSKKFEFLLKYTVAAEDCDIRDVLDAGSGYGELKLVDVTVVDEN